MDARRGYWRTKKILPRAFHLVSTGRHPRVSSAKDNAEAIYKAMTRAERRLIFNPFNQKVFCLCSPENLFDLPRVTVTSPTFVEKRVLHCQDTTSSIFRIVRGLYVR